MLRLCGILLLKSSSGHQFILRELMKKSALSTSCVQVIRFQSYAAMKSYNKLYSSIMHSDRKIDPANGHQMSSSIPPSWSKRNLSIMRVSEVTPGILQPVLDIKYVIENQKDIQVSINARDLATKPDVQHLVNLYQKAKEYKNEMDAIELEKKENSEKFTTLVRVNDEALTDEQVKEASKVQEKGKNIRNRLRLAVKNFNEANDDLVEVLLELPNVLDKETPHSDKKLLKQSTSDKVKLWQFRDYVTYHVSEYEPSGILPVKSVEVPMYHSAEEEMELSFLAQSRLLSAGFLETGMADTVRKSVLHSIGISTDNILRIREENSKSGNSFASYVTGAASLPSLLLLHVQSLIDDNQVFPLRYFVIGRSYDVNKERIAKHNCVVQCLISCPTQLSMDEEFQNLADVMEDFYSKKVGIRKFQTQIVPAKKLALHQRKKYSFIMNKTEDYPSRFLGDISAVGDHLSKRLLCCYKDKNGKTQFLHFVHATFFNITHFLRISRLQKISSKDSVPTDETPFTSKKV